MHPSVDSLAVLLSRFDCAMLTLVDREGRPRTRPLAPLKVPFSGHLWFRLGSDPEPLEEIGRGADVSVAYGAPGNGPYVTVYGWAIVLRRPPYGSAAAGAIPATPLRPEPARQLICVTARAAELWDAASSASRRVFAFSHARPLYGDEFAPAPHDPARMPRAGVAAMSCAQ